VLFAPSSASSSRSIARCSPKAQRGLEAIGRAEEERRAHELQGGIDAGARFDLRGDQMQALEMPLRRTQESDRRHLARRARERPVEPREVALRRGLQHVVHRREG